jgi:hypothetical protein
MQIPFSQVAFAAQSVALQIVVPPQPSPMGAQ